MKSARVPALPPASGQPVYLDVTGQGELSWDRGVPFATIYSPRPAPGVAVVASDGVMCTAGMAVESEDGHDWGYLSAGHCNPTAGDRTLSYNSSKDQLLVPLAAMTGARDDNAGVDSGALWIAWEGESRIAGTWPVAGVLANPAALPAGTMVCLLGAVSGTQCGALVDADDRGRLRFAAESVDGDSGAPVFVVDAETGYATLLAILEGGDDFTTTATYLDPALDRLGAVAVVDPRAAATVADRPGYSGRVTMAD